MHAFSLPVSAPEQLAYRLLQDSDWAQTAQAAQMPAELRTVLAMVFDSPEPMWIAWGPQDKAFFFNDAYLPLLGGKLHGAMGARLDVVWADVWADVSQAIDDAFAGTARSFQNLRLMMDRDGTMKETWWTFSYSPLRLGNGEIAGLLCVVSEQTERVIERDLHSRQVAAITQEAREAHLELVRAREQLRQAQKLEAMGQLTGGVAHDFNNLLQVITGSVDMLLYGWPSDDPRRRYAQAIESAAERATKLTAQLLAFSRRQSLSPEVFDLCESVQALADIITTVVGARIDVDLHLPDVPLPVLLDRNQLDTALINIAVNARDAIEGHGKVTLAVQRVSTVPSVRQSIPLKGDFAAISVTDSGSGIDPSVLERIFEPFFTTKGVGAGTGLGLSQVFGFVKQSEGEVDVQSRPGAGTCFTLYLPLTQCTDSVPRPAPHPGLASGDGLCVLVVEDNVDVADFAVGALRELDYGVVLARNAAEAMAELEHDAARFQLVFTDVVMPGTNGLELARTIRAQFPKLPIILTSGYSELLARDPGHGFTLLRKPYSLKQLAQVMTEAAHGSAR
ncbi:MULTISPECIES: PAS domain-containing sensor histidine kinase [Stenotrophomonas]|uniref:hybrid sensor histidine kinase/response regulator n=1 Tax=Stenotrophomonas TaxID=40323 RepID=UPI000D5411C9|nr:MULTISPECIES: PAS domain-containing sensor histidine kinase [Stenotrophomonas]AWH29557.1 PAS domain-containing sensor histidine kinase [Stenotrophomonas sp. YAU14A_MKIMI4_1]